MMLPSRPPDVQAEITLLPTEEGGRRTPAFSGYRPSHDLGVAGMTNDAVHEYVGCASLPPGATATANMWLSRPEFQEGRLHPGLTFTVQEGGRIVGRGVITKVINEVLLRSGT